MTLRQARAAAALVVLELALALVGCARSETKAPDAGGTGVGSGLSCQQIRMCVFGAPCADDSCVASCAAKGTAAAQAAFETLRACTAHACATGDINCACGEQCQAGGSCLPQADVCLGTATVDDICDAFCA